MNYSTIARIMRATLLAALATIGLASCSDAIYDYEGDCEPRFSVRFVYDYNLKFANAFPAEVGAVKLSLLDENNKVVWQKTESGEALADEFYTMPVDVEPGTYQLVAWGKGLSDIKFTIGPDSRSETIYSTLERETDDDGTEHVRGDIGELYYGNSGGYFGQPITVTFPANEGHHTQKVRMMKDTNGLRVVVHNIEGKPYLEGQLEFEIVDTNGRLDWQNNLIDDSRFIYHPRATGIGSAAIFNGDDTETVSGALTADFRTNRFKANDNSGRLIVRRTDTGEEIINISLVKALLLVKSFDHAPGQTHELSDQEYLDRQDQYSLVFFLGGNYDWIGHSIYINAWKVIYQETDLD